jgi:tetratricopeptide (TPR) repeat protein
MHKFRVFSLILASLIPLMPTSANAQITIDLLGIYQTEELCKNNPSLSNHKLCRAYYRQNPTRRTRPNNSRRRTRPNTFTPGSGSRNLQRCGKIVDRLLELHRQGVTQATVTLPGGGTITDSPDDLVDDVWATCNRSSNTASPTLTVAAPNTSTPNYAADRRYDEGTRLLYEQGDYRGALVAFDRAIAANPKDARAYVHRGYARYALKDYQGAIADAERAMSLDSSLLNAYAVRGNARHGLRDYRGALADANQMIRLNSNSPMGYFNRSMARYGLANYRGALADGDRAVRLAPKAPSSYLVRGMARLGLGDGRKALQDADRAIALGQEAGTPQKILAGGYSWRSTVRYELGDTDEAASDSRTAIALDRDAAGAMLRLAVILYGRGDRQESLRLAEKAIGLDKNSADLEYLKERGWGKRLLADTQTFFKSPEMKELLAAI